MAVDWSEKIVTAVMQAFAARGGKKLKITGVNYRFGTIQFSRQQNVVKLHLRVYVCVCVCVREREREREVVLSL